MEDITPQSKSNTQDSQRFIDELNGVVGGEFAPKPVSVLDEQREQDAPLQASGPVQNTERVIDLDNPVDSIEEYTNSHIAETLVSDDPVAKNSFSAMKDKVATVANTIGTSLTPRPQEIDPSGGAFLGSFKTERPVEVTEDLSSNPVYRSFVNKIDSLIQHASGPLKTKLQVFKEFKVKHQKTFEGILNNLPSIEGLVPSREYIILQQTAEEGSKAAGSYRVKNETLEEEKATWQVPDRNPQVPDVSPAPVVEVEQEVSSSEESQIPTEPLSDEKSADTPEPPPFPVTTPEPPPVPTPEAHITPDLYDEPIGPVRKEDLSPEETEKIESEMRAKLSVARESLATHEAQYKTKVREGKSKFRAVMEKLGAPGKQRPPLEREAEHVEAEKAYLEAKWNLRNFISSRNVKEIEVSRAGALLSVEGEQSKKIDVGVLEQAEKEYRLLQDRMLEMTPEKERSTIEKCFQKWNSLPLAQRVLLSSALLTAGGVALGTVGVSGALAALGWRATRAFVGTNIGLAAGKMYGNAKEKEIKEKREEYLDEYGSKKVLEKDQFAKEEENLEKFFKKEKDEVMQNQIKKGLVTAAVAGVSTVGLGMGGQALMGESAPSGAKVSGNMDTTPKPKVVEAPTAQPAKMSWFERMVKGVPEKETPPSHPVEVTSPEKINLKVYEPVGVKLSSSGFIDTVSKLKTSLQGHSMSPAVEKLLAQSPEKIAMDLGLYKPGQVAESAFGLQGEELTMNANGDITLMHNDGSVNILFDASGKAHQFGEYDGNTMFDADSSSVSQGVSNPSKSIEITRPATSPVVESDVETGLPVEPEGSNTTPAAVAEGVTKDASLVEVSAPKTVDFEKLVSSDARYTGPEDMVSGKLPLKPEYQFDPQFKAERLAYNVRLEKELMNMSPDTFDLRYPIEYNGGRINVFQKGENITVLLNGQKIGTGQIIDGKPGLQYETSLGKGIFGVKSDFEQAFEKAKEEIEKNKVFFKVKK